MDRRRSEQRGPATAFRPYRLEIQKAVSPEAVARLVPDLRVPLLPRDTSFLVSRECDQPFEPFLDFLSDRALTRSPTQLRLHKSLKTVEAWSSDLRDFFLFLDAVQLAWTDVDGDVLLAYLDTMIEQLSPATGMAYADKTIIRRMSTVKSFYTWAHDKGRTRFPLFEVDESRELDARRMNPSILPKGMPRPPPLHSKVRPIPVAELRRILDSIGPRLVVSGRVVGHSSSETTQVALRNRMIAECAIQVGLRRAETVMLETGKVLASKTSERSLYSMAAVEVFGKGSKWRKVNFPVWLLLAVKEYIKKTRPLYAGEEADQHDFVFVSHAKTASRGKPLDPKHVNTIFLAGCKEAGATRVDMRGKVMPAHTFHDLRHNYVLITYFLRKEQGDREPWIYIQSMLGHAFLETTIKTYMRLVRAMEADQTDPYYLEIIGMARRNA